MKFYNGMLIGVLLGAVVALWGNNEQWKREAFNHYAAVYVVSSKGGKMYWMWFDDYARTILLPKAKEKAHMDSYTPPPTAPPKWQRL